MATSESKMLEIINTKYKKNPGILRLLTNNITWTQHGSSMPKIDCKYSEIKVQRISPEASSKIQLQIVLHDGTSYSFQFTDPNPATGKNERDEVKDLLAQLIPAHRMKASKELEEKERILKENPDVYQLYKDLVVSGVITSEEFWSNRGKVSDSLNADSTTQAVGISSVLLGDAQPVSSGCNEVKYNLNADTIEAIFRTYPAVKKKHAEVVPDKMTEKEFWTKFFQSHYFHRDRTSKITASDMFTECAKQDEKEQLTSRMVSFKDHMLDLTGVSPLPNEGYGSNPVDDTTDQSSKNNSGQSLFRRLNHHSLMVLQSSQQSQPSKEAEAQQNGLTNTTSEPPTKKSRVRDVIEYEDLQEEQRVQPQSLKIVSADKYSTQNSVNENGYSGHSSKNTIDSHTALDHCKYEVNAWTPQLTEVLSSDQACHVLTEMSPGGSMMDMTSQTHLQHALTESLTTELKQQYSALAELLRHFWLCFPTTTPFLEEKLVRMGNSLEKYRDNKLQQLQVKLPQEELHLTDHLSQMLNTALTKYRAWEEKKSSRKTS